MGFDLYILILFKHIIIVNNMLYFIAFICSQLNNTCFSGNLQQSTNIHDCLLYLNFANVTFVKLKIKEYHSTTNLQLIVMPMILKLQRKNETKASANQNK